MRIDDEMLAHEISLVYRTALFGLLADEDNEDMTLGDLHQEAGRAVVGWLRVGRYLGGSDATP